MRNILAGVVDTLESHECWALLREADIGRLSIVASGRPEIFPLNFVVDHGTVVFRSAAGTKLSVSPGDLVAFEADGFDHSERTAWSVVLHGVMEPLISFEPLDTDTLPLFPAQGGAKPRFMRIIPESISGRRFHAVEKSTWQVPAVGARAWD